MCMLILKVYSLIVRVGLQFIAELPRDIISTILKASKLPPKELLACCPEPLVASVVHHFFPRFEKNASLWTRDTENVLDRESTHILWPCLRNLPIETLMFRKLYLGRMSEHLLMHLACLTVLRMVNLDNNNLDSSAVTQLMPTLAQLPGLTILGLSNNPVADAAVLAIASGLKHLSSLRVFSLSFDCTDGIGAHVRASTMCKMMSNLGYLGDQGVLDLDGLGIGTKSLGALCHSLQAWPPGPES